MEDVKRGAKKFATGAALAGTLAGTSPAFGQSNQQRPSVTQKMTQTFTATNIETLLKNLEKDKTIEARFKGNPDKVGLPLKNVPNTYRMYDQFGNLWIFQNKGTVWTATKNPQKLPTK